MYLTRFSPVGVSEVIHGTDGSRSTLSVREGVLMYPGSNPSFRRPGTGHAPARQSRQVVRDLAKFWRRVLLPVIERYRHLSIPQFFAPDTAFANPSLYRVLEKENYHDATGIKANTVLERETEHLRTRAGVRVAFAQAQGVLSRPPVQGRILASAASSGTTASCSRARVSSRPT